MLHSHPHRRRFSRHRNRCGTFVSRHKLAGEKSGKLSKSKHKQSKGNATNRSGSDIQFPISIDQPAVQCIEPSCKFLKCGNADVHVDVDAYIDAHVPRQRQQQQVVFHGTKLVH